MEPGLITAVFIRHGESTANAGAVCDDIALVELTEGGLRQARDLAAQWAEAPDLIVTSPFTRARQTAEPTIRRFPHTPVEVWPIEEFTYLQPFRWNGTSVAERRPHADAYWQSCDAAFRDGSGAESFSDLLRRAEAALDKLSAMVPGSRALVFTHGQFMQAVRVTVLHPGMSDSEKMRAFGREDTGIQNGDWIEFVWSDGKWRLNEF
jgi:broad specificity phosphatase PhoE